MRITLDFRNPTQSHCNIAVFINGALSGVLTLRQDEIGSFQQIIANGCSPNLDYFLSKGNPDPPES